MMVRAGGVIGVGDGVGLVDEPEGERECCWADEGVEEEVWADDGVGEEDWVEWEG